MGVIAIAVETLIAAGVTGDALVTAIARMEEAMPVVVERPPVSAGALRTRRYRERKASQSVTEASQTVTCDAQVTVGFPDKEKFPHTPSKEINPSLCGVNITRAREADETPKPARSRGCRIPQGWQPKPEPDLETLFSPQFVASQLASFRDYWQARAGPNAVKLDWQATWRNWLRRAGENGGKSNNLRKGSGKGLDDGWAEIDAEIERIRQAEQGAGSGGKNLAALPGL